MATTTKSNRKKPAKTTKASRVTKSTTKKATASSKKSVAVKEVTTNRNSKVKRSLSPLELIRSIHTSTALAYLVFSGIIIGFVKTTAVPVTLAIQARDEFASNNNVVLGPASEVFYNIQPRYVLVAALIVSAISSILLATKLRKRYETTLAGRVSGLRWITIGLSAAVTIDFVGLLAGVHDLSLLKLSGALIFLTAMLSWMAERDNARAARPKWLAYILSLGAGALAWMPIIVSLIGTSVYGMERFGWHVYALAAVTLAGFIAFAINLYRQIKARGGQRDYAIVESTYLRIDLFTKFAIVLIAVIALK